MEDEKHAGLEAVVEAGRQAAWGGQVIKNSENREFIVRRNDSTLEEIDPINKPLPDHIIDRRSVLQQKSFEDYINRFKTGTSIVFGYPRRGSMEALLDYHEEAGGEPRNVDHVIYFECGFDPDYTPWRGKSGQFISQYDFACFIEEMLHTIASPDGADLLDMAQNLKVNRSVVFKSNRKLASGLVDIEYTEKDEAEQGKSGKVQIPETITIVCPIYMRREPISVEVKLRYQVDKGQPLRFKLDILRRDVIELEQFEQMMAEIETATELPVYMGSAS